MVSTRPAPRHAVGVGETEAPRGRRGPHGSLTFCHPDQPEEQTEHAFVNVLAQGDLSSIRWVCSPLRHAPAPGPGSHLCTIYYASLNFRDIMLATGKLSPDAIPGAGSVRRGRGPRLRARGGRGLDMVLGVQEAPMPQPPSAPREMGQPGLHAGHGVLRP